jgi:hypothetical protein
LPSQATLTWVHRGDTKRVRELVATERSVAETALLSERLFGPDVPIATASRWIEILSVVLREGVISQDAIFHALQKGSRATISRDLDSLYRRGFVFEPEFEGASHRVKWIAMDLSGRHRFYVANEKTHASADPRGELRAMRRPTSRSGGSPATRLPCCQQAPDRDPVWARPDHPPAKGRSPEMAEEETYMAGGVTTGLRRAGRPACQRGDLAKERRRHRGHRVSVPLARCIRCNRSTLPATHDCVRA